MKKHIYVLLSVAFTMLSCESCREMKSVGVKEFSRYLNRRNVVLIDVRTPEEHAEGHIVGTDYNFNVLDDSFERMILENISHDSQVAIYCRSGNRSKTAGVVLERNCYRVVELESGYKGWAEAGMDVEKQLQP